MPISGDSYPFTQGNVDKAPAVPGVYALYDGLETIYIGSAQVSIRSRLQAHKRGDEGRCTQTATRYKREPNNSPLARERQLLTEFVQQYGRLPRCNDVRP